MNKNDTIDDLDFSEPPKGKVQRSTSLKLDNRPRFNQRQDTNGNKFALADFLARASSVGAKIDEPSTYELKYYSSTDIANKIVLPKRYRKDLQQKKFNYKIISNPQYRSHQVLHTESISSRLDVLPELPNVATTADENRKFSAEDGQDAQKAIQWIQQELHSIKLQDRFLFRKLLDLGAQIHRYGGMESCQSFNDELSKVGLERYTSGSFGQNSFDSGNGEDSFDKPEDNGDDSSSAIRQSSITSSSPGKSNKARLSQRLSQYSQSFEQLFNNDGTFV